MSESSEMNGSKKPRDTEQRDSSPQDPSVFDMLNLLRRRLYVSRDDIIANCRTASKDDEGRFDWSVLDPGYHSSTVKTCIRLAATTYEGFNIKMLKRVMFCFLLEILNEGAPASFFTLKQGETKANRQCRNLLSLLITSALAIRLLVLSQLGKKQRRSLKWPLTVEIFVYIRGTVPSELDRN
jgi:hypothetical protein